MPMTTITRRDGTPGSLEADEVIRRPAVRWQCPHCKRSWSNRGRAERHIADCRRRVANRGCLTCAHYCPAIKGDPLDPMDRGDAAGCAEGIAWPDGRPIINCAAWIAAERKDTP